MGQSSESSNSIIETSMPILSPITEAETETSRASSRIQVLYYQPTMSPSYHPKQYYSNWTDNKSD